MQLSPQLSSFSSTFADSGQLHVRLHVRTGTRCVRQLTPLAARLIRD